MDRPTQYTHQMVVLARADDPELDQIRAFCATRNVQVTVTDMLPTRSRMHIVWVPHGWQGDPADALVFGAPIDPTDALRAFLTAAFSGVVTTAMDDLGAAATRAADAMRALRDAAQHASDEDSKD